MEPPSLRRVLFLTFQTPATTWPALQTPISTANIDVIFSYENKWWLTTAGLRYDFEHSCFFTSGLAWNTPQDPCKSNKNNNMDQLTEFFQNSTENSLRFAFVFISLQIFKANFSNLECIAEDVAPEPDGPSLVQLGSGPPLPSEQYIGLGNKHQNWLYLMFTGLVFINKIAITLLHLATKVSSYVYSYDTFDYDLFFPYMPALGS